MLPNYSPVVQALLGTLFTWGLTAAGAALVVFMKGTQRKFLDSSLGFAGGVMLAASYWSLLAPAIEMAESSGNYGEAGEYSYLPVALGFSLGAFFVYAADKLMEFFHISSPNIALAIQTGPKLHSSNNRTAQVVPDPEEGNLNLTNSVNKEDSSSVRQRQAAGSSHPSKVSSRDEDEFSPEEKRAQKEKWKRILLLVIAVTVHNIPEGLAVGVGFGAVGKSAKATFGSARNLAIGIGIQNFPEGLAVSLPLRGAGFSLWKSFWYGQLSGMVEPVAGLLGAVGVAYVEPALPYALAFAAGAMVFVVFDDLIPEASSCGNGRLASWGAIFGFVVMMCLDVGLG